MVNIQNLTGNSISLHLVDSSNLAARDVTLASLQAAAISDHEYIGSYKTLNLKVQAGLIALNGDIFPINPSESTINATDFILLSRDSDNKLLPHSVQSAGAAPSESEAHVTLTAAQVKALSGTPFQLVAAPGAGKANIPLSIELFMKYGSVAYGNAGGQALEFFYPVAGDVASFQPVAGILDQTTDQRRVFVISGTVVPGDNEAIMVQMISANLTNGDSMVKFSVRYKTVTLLS